MAVTLQNTAITLDPNELATFQGWTISNGIAYHSGCFAGYVTLRNIEVEAGKTYIVKYNVEEYANGVVYPVVGGVSGTSESSLGEKETTIEVPEDATDLRIRFYSDGELAISYMAIYPQLEEADNAVTLAFNSENNRWTTYYDFKPDMMIKFVNDLFSWKDGRLYKHNSNETRNNFYGVQYYSEVEIIFNIEPYEVKNLYSIRVNSNLAFSVENVYIRPIVGKQSGQQSRIKKNNFAKLSGQWSADFLRNMLDPLQPTELDALFKGNPLQGTVASITLRSTDTTEVRLVSIDILGARQDFNY
jgi:hypothetical protein